MTEHEKIAEALGLELGRATGNNDMLDGFYYGRLGTVVCAEGNLGIYLNSPEGREAVRDRVRELWCEHTADEFGWWTRFVRIEHLPPIGRTILRLREESKKAAPEVYLDICKNTEHEAWLAALLWLAERKEADDE